MAKRQQWVKGEESDESSDGSESQDENAVANLSIETSSVAEKSGAVSINSIAATLEGYDCLVTDYKSQDGYLAKSLGENMWLLAVFDGHDKDGRDIAEHVQEKLPLLLAEKLQFNETYCPPPSDKAVVTVLKESFSDIHTSLPDTFIGGTTASVVLQHGTKLFLANVGDSVTVVAVCNKDNNASNIVYQTRVDRPNIPQERDRIEKLGGKVSACGDGRIMYQDENGAWQPGIAMSRSIGDKDMIGASSEPIVDVIDMKDLIVGVNGESFLLVLSATDGMTDCVPPAHLVNSMIGAFSKDKDDHDDTNSVAAIKNLVQQVVHSRKTKTGGCYRDDVTIVASKLRLL